ncbi:hypothetical protein FRC16_009469 [Serendipita sp. 398]|nr:hypothetical protein FRC16_009469 [Serendipita sp. 398]
MSNLRRKSLIKIGAVESTVVHPIQRCNEDILSTIFEWYTCDHMIHRNRRAAQLTMVCRRWRRIALQTPAIWRHFDLDLSRSIPSLRKQWDWLVSKRPAAPDDIRIDCTRGRYLDQSTLVDIWSQCDFSSLERVAILEFAYLRLSTWADILNPSIALHNTSIDRLRINSCKCITSYGTNTPWEVDQLLESFPRVRKLDLSHQIHFSLGPRNVFLHTTYLDIKDCFGVSIFPGLASFVNLETLSIKCTTIIWSVTPTTIIRLPALQLLCIQEVTGFPWKKLECPSLQGITGYESVSDSVIQFLELHPHARKIDLKVDKQFFASFARAIPHVEELDLGGYIEGLVEWQMTTDLIEPPFPNLRRLVIGYKEPRIWLNLFESIVKTYCLPSTSTPPGQSQSPLHLIGESNSHRRTVERLCVYGPTELFKSGEWSQSPLLAGCIRSSFRQGSWSFLEFRWPESNQSH